MLSIEHSPFQTQSAQDALGFYYASKWTYSVYVYLTAQRKAYKQGFYMCHNITAYLNKQGLSVCPTENNNN